MAVSTKHPKPPRTSRAGKRHKQVATVAPAIVEGRATLACALDRNADLLIYFGNHLAAERLSQRAAALREAGR